MHSWEQFLFIAVFVFFAVAPIGAAILAEKDSRKRKHPSQLFVKLLWFPMTGFAVFMLFLETISSLNQRYFIEHSTWLPAILLPLVFLWIGVCIWFMNSHSKLRPDMRTVYQKRRDARQNALLLTVMLGFMLLFGGGYYLYIRYRLATAPPACVKEIKNENGVREYEVCLPKVPVWTDTTIRINPDEYVVIECENKRVPIDARIGDWLSYPHEEGDLVTYSTSFNTASFINGKPPDLGIPLIEPEHLLLKVSKTNEDSVKVSIKIEK